MGKVPGISFVLLSVRDLGKDLQITVHNNVGVEMSLGVATIVTVHCCWNACTYLQPEVPGVM